MPLLKPSVPTPSRLRRSILATMVSAACSGAALAQVSAADDSVVEKSSQPLEEVVVTASTGTLLRGVAPIGTNVVGVSREDVQVIGVANSNDLLAQIPQVSSTFNSRPTMSSNVGAGMPMPKLRDVGVSGGNTTLALMNGLRLPGSGLIQTVPNVAAIPPGVIDRVEVVLDGGSSIYGSDAIAGVINFITRDQFEGVELSVEGGGGDGYTSTTTNLTLGRAWDGGSGLVSLYHNENDAILGRDRDYITADSRSKGGGDYRSRQCVPGNIGVNGVSYALPGRVEGVNLCDPTDPISFIPEESNSTIFAALQQQLGSRATLELATFYSEWDIDIRGNTADINTGRGALGTVTVDNPYFAPVGDETAQQVDFSFSPVAGAAVRQGSEFDAFSFMPELTVDLPSDWRLKVSYSYGLANTKGIERGVDPAALAGALAASDLENALNPYDVSQTNPAVLDRILGYVGTYGDAEQSHHQLRAVIDGAVFSLPTGEVQLAVGAEYYRQNYEVEYGGGPAGDLSLVAVDTDRDVNSLFGEAVVPLMNSDAGTIDLTTSVRYDDYSDFGSTTNPKFGIDYAPSERLRLRAQWGTSFQAPSLADSGDAVDTRAQVVPVSPWRASDSPDSDFIRPTILLAGGSDGLEPEESESWSAGFDWTPAWVDDLKVSATYFSLDYENAITIAPFFMPSILYNTAALESFYTLNPTLEQALTLTDGLRIDGPGIESMYSGGPTPYVIVDARRNNMAALEMTGLDVDISKAWATDFGSLSAGLSGTYYLKRDAQSALGTPFFDELEEGDYGDFDVVASLGAFAGKWSGNLRVLHSDGWENVSGKLDSYTTVNLYGSYDLGGFDFLEQVQLTLNVDNVFDEDPPYFDGVTGYQGGSVLGRVFYLGLNVKL